MWGGVAVGEKKEEEEEEGKRSADIGLRKEFWELVRMVSLAFPTSIHFHVSYRNPYMHLLSQLHTDTDVYQMELKGAKKKRSGDVACPPLMFWW